MTDRKIRSAVVVLLGLVLASPALYAQGTQEVNVVTTEPLADIAPVDTVVPPALAPDGTALPEIEIDELDGQTTVLGGLNKITARVTTINAPIGQEVSFGTLRILARTCNTRPPEEPPETTAFLEISDVVGQNPESSVFSGWMFASSPAVAALEHPVYDVWVLECRTASGELSEAN